LPKPNYGETDIGLQAAMAHATLSSISKISVIQQDDANHYRNIADVPSAPGARNCVFVPESGGILRHGGTKQRQEPTGRDCRLSGSKALSEATGLVQQLPRPDKRP
jgi:hypothetical protein